MHMILKYNDETTMRSEIIEVNEIPIHFKAYNSVENLQENIRNNLKSNSINSFSRYCEKTEILISSNGRNSVLQVYKCANKNV